MKKTSVFFVSSIVLFSQLWAQIPVMDSSSIEQQVRSQVETMAKWKIQYDQMIRQIEQAKQQYESLTGGRGLGTIMNDPALRDYLPKDWQTVYDSVRTGGYQGLSGRGAHLYEANKIFDSCAHLSLEDERTVCQAQAVKASQDKGLVLDAYDAAKNRLHQIDQLMTQINSTQDLRAIAELQARIAIEQASLQNEHTKLQLYALAISAEEKIQVQREREIHARTWSARGVVKVKPLIF